MQLVHSSNRTVATSLDEIAAEIYDTVDRMVMRVGELLERAHTLHPEDWKRWVADELPFGLDTARRFRMIYLAYRHLPPETLARCPKAWQAMFAIRHLDQPALEAALDSGELGIGTTVREAVDYIRVTHRPDRFTEADVVAGKLMGYGPNQLSQDVLEQLRVWATATG